MQLGRIVSRAITKLPEYNQIRLSHQMEMAMSSYYGVSYNYPIEKMTEKLVTRICKFLAVKYGVAEDFVNSCYFDYINASHFVQFTLRREM